MPNGTYVTVPVLFFRPSFLHIIMGNLCFYRGALKGAYPPLKQRFPIISCSKKDEKIKKSFIINLERRIVTLTVACLWHSVNNIKNKENITMKNKYLYFKQCGHCNFMITHMQLSHKFFITKRFLRIRKHCTKN